MDKEIKEIGKMTYKLNKSIDNDLDIIFFFNHRNADAKNIQWL